MERIAEKKGDKTPQKGMFLEVAGTKVKATGKVKRIGGTAPMKKMVK